MRLFNKLYGISLFTLLLSVASCTSETEEQHRTSAPAPSGSEARREVMLTLKNKLSVVKTKAGDAIATADENKISSLDIYVFGSTTENGTYTYQERFSYRESSAEMPSGNDVTPLDLTAVGSDGKQTNALLSLKKGLFVKIYCIANQSKLIDPATDTVFNGFIPLVQSNPGQPGNTVTEGTPTESDFLLFKSIQLDPASATDILKTPLPMTGAYATPLDLTDFGNARRGSDLFPIRPYGDMPEAKPDELITTPERRFYGENANKGIQAGAFYSYPSPLKDKGFLILKGMYKINESESKEVSYRIPFTQQAADGNQTFLEIANNHRYTIAITAADEYHLDCTLYVADWTDDGSIDDFKPDQDSGEIDVTIPAEFTDDTKYDPDTRSVSMSLKPKSQFTVTTTATANLTVYKKYVGGIDAQQYDWLEISEPAVSTKAASMNYNYTFSLKEDYTLGRYPRAVLRFTNTMNGSETTFFVEAVSVPQADVTPQVGDNNPNSFDAENKLVNLYRITGSNAHVRITCPDGSEVDSKPDWLDVAVYKQSGAETTYSFTLNDRDVTGVTDDKGTVVFYNKKANDLKTDIVVQLLDATLKPDFTYPSLNDGKNSYEAPAGDTPGNINMQISDNNEFSIGCKSMLGIEIGLDFDGGSEWLKVKGAPVTKTLNENTQLTFFLDNAKLRGAKKATVTLKNKIGGENTVFTVSPVFPAPTVTFVSGSNSPTQNTMTGTDIKLYQVKGSQVSIKANALGGTCVKNIEGDITVEAADDYAVEKTYVVTWKSGNSATFQIANKSDETKATTTYTVNAPATTIEASNLYVKAANSGNTNISVTSPEGVKATVLNWNKGDQWFDISTDQTTGSGAKNIVITQRNNINAIMKSVTIRLTNKIAGGASKDITVTPNGFVAPTLSESSKTFDNFSKSYSTTTTFTVSSPGGSNYVKMTNESVASISKSNNKYTITLKDKGSTVITIANASSTDLTSTYTLTVKASKNYNGKTAYIYGNYLIAPEDAASSIALKDVDKTICSKQTGATWRIPTSSEWRTILGTSGTNALPSSSALWQDWYNKNLFVLTLGAYASMTSYFSSDSETMRFFSGGANVATENNQNAIGHVRCITDK